MKRLLPALAPGQLYPANTVYMARTNLFETRLLGYTPLQLDGATSILMGVLNGYATVRHRAATGAVILDLFQRAGIEVNEELYSYQTEEEARAHGTALVNAGKKLFWPYPPPAVFYPDNAHLVAPDLYRFLNAKQNLNHLVAPAYSPGQELISHDELATREFSGPVCLKAAGEAATGWGFAVHPCLDRESFAVAKNWFASRRQDIPAILIQPWLEIRCCWCAGLAISESAAVCFGGVEQLFSAPGKQSGSIIDPEWPFPAEGIAVAVQIGERARSMGFRGVAGLDIGLTAEGHLVVFDPNFRVAASTQQLLFHEAATTRSGLPVSQSFQVMPTDSFETVAGKLHGPIEQGWFVPTRFFNGEQHPLSQGKHIVTGFVLGADRNATAAASARLRALLLGA